MASIDFLTDDCRADSDQSGFEERHRMRLIVRRHDQLLAAILLDEPTVITCEALQMVGIEAPTDDDQRAAVEVSLGTRRKRGDDVVDVGLDVDTGFAKELALTLFPPGEPT